MKKVFRLGKIVRGAAMVEYALLLVAVLVLSATAYKSLGPKVKGSAENATKSLDVSNTDK